MKLYETGYVGLKILSQDITVLIMTSCVISFKNDKMAEEVFHGQSILLFKMYNLQKSLEVT